MAFKKGLVFFAFVFAAPAFATFDLLKTGKRIECFAEDNVVITLNAKRTTLKFMVEGESNGPVKIDSFQTDGEEAVYRAGEMSLRLGPHIDEFQYDESSDYEPVECHL
jgi:hypothetical protein